MSSGQQHTREETARRGAEAYRRLVAPRLTPADTGKYVVLDIDTGEYEIDPDHLTAALRLRARLPGVIGWVERVGRPTAFRLGGWRRP